MPEANPKETLVLLVNTGSPAAPSKEALKTYLAEFLGDSRVVEMPRLLWLPILHGIILRKRPEASAARYKTVWTEKGAPLVAVTAETAEALEKALGEGWKVRWAMRYGTHRVVDELPKFLDEIRPERLVVLPLFAQFATQTTTAVYDAVEAVRKKHPWRGKTVSIQHYHTNPAYIRAVADDVRRHWAAVGPLGEKGKLLMSFHGIPQASSDRGDPYEAQCRETARLIAEELGLPADAWTLSFQSKFGRAKWLEPASIDTAKRLASEGVERLDVICPGFAADCLETIEEIGDELKGIFLAAGGKTFHYIPAMNAQPEAVAAYAAIVKSAVAGA